jgi:hypothetical protein
LIATAPAAELHVVSIRASGLVPLAHGLALSRGRDPVRFLGKLAVEAGDRRELELRLADIPILPRPYQLRSFIAGDWRHSPTRWNGVRDATALSM